MTTKSPPQGPGPLPHFLNTYRGRQLDRVALPVGGIGTGTLSVGGRGQLLDWEIVNHTAKGFAPRNSFFAVSTRQGIRPVDLRLLEGLLAETAYEGESGSPTALAGMPRFSKAVCRTAYPFINIALTDPASPVTASILSYNPFVPGDVEASSWPVAVVEIELTNRLKSGVEASVFFGCENFVGTDGIDTLACKKRNRARDSSSLGAILMDAPNLPAQSELRGDFCIAVDRTAGRFTSSTGLAGGGWNNDIQMLFERLARHGDVFQPKKARVPVSQLCLSRTLQGGESSVWRFFVAWRFPNRLAWSDTAGEKRPRVGNYYAKLGKDSWTILQRFERTLPALREKSVQFANTFVGSSLPSPIKEAALCNLTVLRSQTVFRTPDGRFFGYEGGHRNKQSGGTIGSCSHVWGYDLATSFLFSDIARSFRELHFGPSQYPDGAIAFRTGLPLARSRRYKKVAADGQLAAIIGFHRDFCLSGDQKWTRALWPQVRKALLFCWRKGSWDADQDGVMEGCQHNTMDVDYFGPNPLMQGLYVTALRAMAELADVFNDVTLKQKCERLTQAGARYLEQRLFNGEYFIQRVPKSTKTMTIDRRLACGKTNFKRVPDYQVGTGVLIDQMLGGLHARVCSLAEPASPTIIRTALLSVVRHNHRYDIGRELNHMRTFAVQKEPGTLMASWPKADKPSIPFPYYCEVMTGFEHVLGAHLLYHGEHAQGLKIIASIRSRFTGNQRNPFNEAEWGNHYARSLASWGSVWAWTGQSYCARSGELRFRNPRRRALWPWFIGNAWGYVEIGSHSRRKPLEVTVGNGAPHLAAIRIGDHVALPSESYSGEGKRYFIFQR